MMQQVLVVAKKQRKSVRRDPESFRLSEEIDAAINLHRFYAGKPYEEKDSELLSRMIDRLKEAIDNEGAPEPPSTTDPALPLMKVYFSRMEGAPEPLRAYYPPGDTAGCYWPEGVFWSFRPKADAESFMVGLRRKLKREMQKNFNNSFVWNYIFYWASMLPVVEPLASSKDMADLIASKFGVNTEISILEVWDTVRSITSYQAFQAWLAQDGKLPSSCDESTIYRLRKAQVSQKQKKKTLPFGKYIKGVGKPEGYTISTIEVLHNVQPRMTMTQTWRNLHKKDFGSGKDELTFWIYHRSQGDRKAAELSIIQKIPRKYPSSYKWIEVGTNPAEWKATFLEAWQELLAGRVKRVYIRGFAANWELRT